MYIYHINIAAFGDSEDDLEMGPMSPTQSPPEDLLPPAAPNLPCPVQLTICKVMHATGGPDYLAVLHNTDEYMGPHSGKIPSERCGGEARLANLKRKASNIAQSVAETFAYCTLKTVSIEEAANIFETFGNVCYICIICENKYYMHRKHILHMLHILNY